MALTTAQQVQQLYIGYLGRAAEKTGLDYWVDVIDRGLITLDNVRTNFVNFQPEYAEVYGGLSRADTVRTIYGNLFEREFDPEGFEYWVNGEGSVVPPDNLIAAFLAAAGPGDDEVLARKMNVANAFTSAAGTDHYTSGAGAAIIADVADAASENAALGLIYTVDDFLDFNNVGSAPIIGAKQSLSGAAEQVSVGGTAGLSDIYLVNTDNFDARGDIVRFENFETDRDFLFLAREYHHVVGSPAGGNAGRLEIFLEQQGSDVRMSVETEASGGPDVLTIVVVGATVAEMTPVDLV